MIREELEGRSKIKLNVSKSGFVFIGVDYSKEDYVYVKPQFIMIDELKIQVWEEQWLKSFCCM